MQTGAHERSCERFPAQKTCEANNKDLPGLEARAGHQRTSTTDPTIHSRGFKEITADLPSLMLSRNWRQQREFSVSFACHDP